MKKDFKNLVLTSKALYLKALIDHVCLTAHIFIENISNTNKRIPGKTKSVSPRTINVYIIVYVSIAGKIYFIELEIAVPASIR